MYAVPLKVRRRHYILWSWITIGSKPAKCMVWELSPGLEKQQVLLTAKPSHQFPYQDFQFKCILIITMLKNSPNNMSEYRLDKCFCLIMSLSCSNYIPQTTDGILMNYPDSLFFSTLLKQKNKKTVPKKHTHPNIYRKHLLSERVITNIG